MFAQVIRDWSTDDDDEEEPNVGYGREHAILKRDKPTIITGER
jgi:hypothetical protein